MNYPKPEWWMPKAWPRPAWRLFVVTIPVSGPLWLAAVVVGHLLGFVVCLVAVPLLFFLWLVDELWDDPVDSVSSNDGIKGNDNG